jgi:hypothetical protein
VEVLSLTAANPGRPKQTRPIKPYRLNRDSTSDSGCNQFFEHHVGRNVADHKSTNSASNRVLLEKMFNYYALLASAAVLLLVYGFIDLYRSTGSTTSESNEKQHHPEQEDPLKAYQEIEPLLNFDWKSTPPMKLRPFKPKYHLTMGKKLLIPDVFMFSLLIDSFSHTALETIPFSDLLQMDNTYLERIKLRRQLMDAHPESTLACNDVAEKATLELYDWLIGTYLPRRFPTCFSLVIQEATTADTASKQDSSILSQQQQPTHLLNNITSELITLHSDHPLTALRTLSSHVDTDFLILLPQPSNPTSTTSNNNENTTTTPHQPTYHLQAFATAFPSGFSTLSKLSLPLSAIHAPVPSYAPKLSRSMDRSFARLPLGTLARRANWTITTTPALFAESGTHMHDTFPSSSSSSSPEQKAEQQAASIAAQKADLEIGEMRLRCELQTLHRLPRTGALVFAFKTYQYGLGEVRAEGNGEALAEATEGFLKGSVPEMSVYKREAVWGESVRDFLRREF